MRPLRLHASALNDDEYDLYTSSLKELAEIEEGNEGGGGQDDEYFERITLGVREVRAWLRGRYSSVPAATIDTILKYFSPNLAHADTLSGGQFFAALRLITHVQTGQELDRGLAFVQARIQSSRPPSPRKQPPPPPRRTLTDSHPQPPQHPSQKPEPSTNPFLARPPKPIVPPPRSEDGGLSKGPPLPPRKSAPASQTSFLPPPRHASAQPTPNLPPIPPMPPVPSASSSSSTAQQHTFVQSRPPPPQLPPKPTVAAAAPVSSTGPTTSNLIKQSLQASKVAHSMKRAEEQLEKERIMQVLKSSNPLASIGSAVTSSPFRQPPQPPPSNTKPRSQSPAKPIILTTTASGSTVPVPHHSSAMSVSASSSRSSADSASSPHHHYGVPPPIPPSRPFPGYHRRQSPSVSSIVSSSAISAGSLEQVALASPPVPPTRPLGRPRQSSSPFRRTPSHSTTTSTPDPSHSPYGSPSRKTLHLGTSVELVRPPTHPDRDRERRQPPTLQTTSSSFDAVYGNDGTPSARSSPASITGFQTPFSSTSSSRVRSGGSSGENSPTSNSHSHSFGGFSGAGTGGGGRVWRSKSLHHGQGQGQASPVGVGGQGYTAPPEVPPRRPKKRPESMQVLSSSTSSTFPNIFDEPTVDRDFIEDEPPGNGGKKYQAPPRHGSLSRHSSVGSTKSGRGGHRKSSLSVSAIGGPGGASPFGDDDDDDGEDRSRARKVRAHSSSNPTSISTPGKTITTDPPTTIPTTTTKLNPLKTAFEQTKSTLTGTLEQLQPKLEKARYKAEAGLLPKRGFVPPSSSHSSHPHLSSHSHSSSHSSSHPHLNTTNGGGGGVHIRRHGEDEQKLVARSHLSSDEEGGIDSGDDSGDDGYWRGRERDNLKWPVGQGEGWTRL